RGVNSSLSFGQARTHALRSTCVLACATLVSHSTPAKCGCGAVEVNHPQVHTEVWSLHQHHTPGTISDHVYEFHVNYVGQVTRPRRVRDELSGTLERVIRACFHCARSLAPVP